MRIPNFDLQTLSTLSAGPLGVLLAVFGVIALLIYRFGMRAAPLRG